MKLSKTLTGLLVVGSLVVSPLAMAKNNGNHDTYGNKSKANWVKKDKHKNTDKSSKIKKVKKDSEHDDERDDDKYEKSTSNHDASTYAKDGDTRLPPGLQKNVARGKALPPGWVNKISKDDYSVITQDGRQVIILDKDVYDRATLLSRPRDGVVQVKLDNRTLEIVEATRAVLNVLN